MVSHCSPRLGYESNAPRALAQSGRSVIPRWRLTHPDCFATVGKILWCKRMAWQLGSELPRGGNFLTRWVGRLVFRAFGWKIEGEFPNREKAIVALVPHSSNIDFFLAAAFIWGTGMKASFLVKHTVFWFPLGSIIRGLGGIPVDRTRANGLVADVTRQFQEKSKLVVGLTCGGCDRASGRGCGQADGRKGAGGRGWRVVTGATLV